MSTDAALILAFFLIVTSLFAVVWRKQVAKQKELEDEFKKAATMRGWTFNRKVERGHRIYTFTGTTNGVAWVTESTRRLAGEKRRQRRRLIARWHGTFAPGVQGPIVGIGVPKGKEDMGQKIAAGDGMVARLAQKAASAMFDSAIDVYFGAEIGAEINAQELKSLETVSIPGFILMAKDPGEATRIMAEGLKHALESATNERSHVLSEEDRPYFLVRSKGVSLARAEEIRSVVELEQFVNAGVGLTKAFRFGRPIS